MKAVYKKIWNLAKPYYEKSRPMDIDHIKWMIKMVDEICKNEKVDESLLMPLSILHDVGYISLKDPETNYYNKNIRKMHMKVGGSISKQILNSIGYPKNKSKKIVHYVEIHDNWAFGEVEIYKKDKILGIFKDLDYLWIYTKKGCHAIKKILNKNDKEMLEHLKGEVSPIFGKKPFSSPITRQLRETYLEERKKELL